MVDESDQLPEPIIDKVQRWVKYKHMDETVEVGALAALSVSNTALLTTFRANRQPVSTPVSVALRGGSAYFVTSADSGKAKRLARNDRVELTPCTVSGAPIGITVGGRAHPLEDAAARAHGLLRPTGPLFWSWLLYRLRGRRMRFFEVDAEQITAG